MVLEQHLNAPLRINTKYNNSFGITHLFSLSTQMAPNRLQYEIWPIIWTFTYKTQVWGRFMFWTVKEIILYHTHGSQLDTRMKLKWQAFILHHFKSIMSSHHWQYFCDIYIFNMRISSLICVFLIINQCSSFSFQYFREVNAYNTAAWFSALAIGRCQSYPKPCMGWCWIFPRDVIMLTPCFVFLTEPVLLQRITVNYNPSIPTHVFNDLIEFCSFIVSKIYNSIKLCSFLNKLYLSSMSIYKRI